MCMLASHRKVLPFRQRHSELRTKKIIQHNTAIIQLGYCSLGYIRYKRKVDNAVDMGYVIVIYYVIEMGQRLFNR